MLAPRLYEDRYQDPEDAQLERDFDDLLDRLFRRGLTAAKIEEWIKEGFVQWDPPPA